MILKLDVLEHHFEKAKKTSKVNEVIHCDYKPVDKIQEVKNVKKIKGIYNVSVCRRKS